MEFIRLVENPRKCMQRLGFLKWLTYFCSKTYTSSLTNLGDNLISTLTQKVRISVDENLFLYIKKTLIHDIHRNIYSKVTNIEELEKINQIDIELQDAYLSDFNIPSKRGRLTNFEKVEFPIFATNLSLIKKGTYSLTVRGNLFLNLIRSDEIKAFKEYLLSSNPLLLSLSQKILLLYSLVERDGDILIKIYNQLLKREDAFSDLEVSELLPEILEEIVKESRVKVRNRDDIKRIQRLEKTIEKLKKIRGKASTGGGGIRHEIIAIRLEPFVDIGLLLKNDPFEYKYIITDSTKIFFKELINAESIKYFLDNVFFHATNDALNLNKKYNTNIKDVLPSVKKAYDVLKSPLGYVPILELALLSTIYSINDNDYFFEIVDLINLLKYIHKENPLLIRFNVDRLGNLTFVKFNDDIIKIL